MTKKNKSLDKLNFVEVYVEGSTLEERIAYARAKLDRAYAIKVARLRDTVSAKDSSSIVKYSLDVSQMRKDKDRFERAFISQIIMLDKSKSTVRIDKDSELSSFLAEDNQ